MRRTMVFVTLLTLVMSALAIPAQAAGATLVVGPTSAPQNSSVGLSLAGFTPHEVVSLWLTLPDYSVQAVGDLEVGDSGAATKTLAITNDMPVGVYSVSARGNSSERLATARLEVLTGAGPTPSSSIILTVSQHSRPQGECFDFVGTNFDKGEPIAIWLRTPDGSVSGEGLESEFLADGGGGFAYYICFGRLAAEGTYALTAQGKKSGLTGIVEFKLERGDYLGAPSDGVVLLVDPAVARQLETVTLVGGGFEPGEEVSFWITLPNGVVLPIGSGFTEDGTFQQDLTLPTLPVGTHYISAYGQNSGLRAVAELELLPGNGG